MKERQCRCGFEAFPGGGGGENSHPIPSATLISQCLMAPHDPGRSPAKWDNGGTRVVARMPWSNLGHQGSDRDINCTRPSRPKAAKVMPGGSKAASKAGLIVPSLTGLFSRIA